MPYEPFMDWRIAAARGLDNISTIHKFGQTPAATTTFETVWAGSGNYVYPSSSMVMRIVSDSVNDATGGSGAVNVTIEGLDANYAMQTETVELTGVTPVTLTNDYVRVYRAYVSGASITALNDGKIYIFDDAGTVTVAGVPTATTDVFAVIASDTNQTLQAVYTVPRGYTGYLMNFTTAGGTATNNPLRLQESGAMGGFPIRHENSIPVKYSATTDIEFRCRSSASGALVDASFEVLLVSEGE
jgi:hypothetical protein